MNEAVACKNLAFLYENSMGIEEDIDKATDLYGKACYLGNKEACYSYKALVLWFFE